MQEDRRGCRRTREDVRGYKRIKCGTLGYRRIEYYEERSGYFRMWKINSLRDWFI
jgi:hypothetical protein